MPELRVRVGVRVKVRVEFFFMSAFKIFAAGHIHSALNLFRVRFRVRVRFRFRVRCTVRFSVRFRGNKFAAGHIQH